MDGPWSGSTRRPSSSGSTSWTAPRTGSPGRSGSPPAYMSMLVNGGRSPSGRIRRRMQKALGVTHSHQLFKTEDKHERP